MTRSHMIIVHVLPASLGLSVAIAGQRIKANPGFTVLQALEASNGLPAGVATDPVIAWLFDADSNVPLPIGIQGLHRDYDAIERPDGQVEEYGGEWNADIQEWIESLQHRYAYRNDIDSAGLVALRGQAREEFPVESLGKRP